MSIKKTIVFAGILTLGAIILAACTPGPVGPEGPAGPAGPMAAATDLTCTQCHNDTTVIVSKVAQFEEKSVHGTGESYEDGNRTACAGCHGHEGAKTRINAGLLPHDESVVAIVNVSPFNCRTCHEVHTSYTDADWALTGGEELVKMEYTAGTFDGGAGNLCANCHQVRNPAPTVADGNVSITTSRFGPHYGVPAQMMLGEGGLGVEFDATNQHYAMVTDTCVGCHMGEEYNHTYVPVVERCQACHTELEDFDNNGVQTEVEGMLEELHTLFVNKKLLNPETDLWGIYDPGTGKFSNPSTNTPLVVTEAVANAMWNYKFVTYDKSMGVHNAAYAKALLEAALETMR